MSFLMRKLLETSSDSCYHFPDALTDRQLCLITASTPGGWSRPLRDLWEESQGCWVQSRPKAIVSTKRKLIKQPPILGSYFRRFLNIVSGLSSHHEPRETTPNPLGYFGKGSKVVGCSPDPLKCDFGSENCWKHHPIVVIIFRTL